MFSKVFLFADIFAHMLSLVFRLNIKFLWFLCQGSLAINAHNAIFFCMNSNTCLQISTAQYCFTCMIDYCSTQITSLSCTF